MHKGGARVRKYALIFLFIHIFAVTGICLAQEGRQIKWTKYDGGFFTVEIPEGWQVDTASACSMFSFIIKDPQNPIRRIFYLGQVGPFYLTEMQRQIDYWYENMGGFPIAWIDMPAVEPLSADNFFKQYHLIAQSPLAENFITGLPRLDNFQVISAISQVSPIPESDAKIVRGVFSEFDSLGEGLFYATVTVFTPYDGENAGVGSGMGYFCTGITSYKKDFADWEPVLLKCLNTFTIDKLYLEKCIADSDVIWSRISQVNTLWADISDILSKSWGYKNNSDDILSEKRSDAIRGVQRLYDPETEDVYEVKNGFYERYDINRQNYEKKNLKLIPDDKWELWKKVPKPF